MKLTKSQTSKLSRKLNRVVTAVKDNSFPVNAYELETMISIAKQVKEGFLLSDLQGAFVLNLHKRWQDTNRQMKLF